MTAQNPPTQKQLRCTPPQMAALVLLEHLEHSLAQAAAQMRDQLAQQDVFEAIVGAGEVLGKRKRELVEAWSRTIQLASPADMPPAIPNKIIGGL